MIIGIPRERRPAEMRVAATPETVRKYAGLGLEVLVERDAGEAAFISNQAFADAGAQVVDDPAAVFSQSDILIKVQRPLAGNAGDVDELSHLRPGSILVGLLAPAADPDLVRFYAEREVVAFALEYLPRITRAQSMDVLSSQNNLAGYKAVIDAVAEYTHVVPMMMTAAGTVAPARVLVLGAGVAGLQAVATSRRLGAIVTGYDVRPAAREQVESLGARFIAPDSPETAEAETAGGYAREMSANYQKAQHALLAETVKSSDIVICTALIPGKPAPRLIDEAMVQSMKPGSVIVDLAVEQGGNCAHSRAGEMALVNGVKIIGHLNMPARLAPDASALYARNLLHFLTPFWNQEAGALAIDWEDEIVKATLLTRDRAVVNPAFSG